MAFRTDPRFETYNSSGYVYKPESETLLLKSRHKTQLEEIKMSYIAPKPAATPKKVEEAPEAQEASQQPAQTQTANTTEEAQTKQTQASPSPDANQAPAANSNASQTASPVTTSTSAAGPHNPTGLIPPAPGTINTRPLSSESSN